MTTIERILDAIETITCKMDHVYKAIENIDNSVPAKAQSIADVVKARELTNRRVIDFYEAFLDELDWEDVDDED